MLPSVGQRKVEVDDHLTNPSTLSHTLVGGRLTRDQQTVTHAQLMNFIIYLKYDIMYI